MHHIGSHYVLKPLNPYFLRWIGTHRSVVFNFPRNRILCNLKWKSNNYIRKLDFSYVIPYSKPSLYLCPNRNQSLGKEFQSITFKYLIVNGMILLYDYFIGNIFYCDI